MTDPSHPDPWEHEPDDERSVGTAGWIRMAALGAALLLLWRAAGGWGLVMFFGLIFMIFLHELGHFVMAKRAGMKVTEFFLGFGPRLWSFRRGETEYGIKAIPAGAYVKIIGMNSLEEVEPEDEARTYRAQPFWQRFGVAVAGSATHFAQALVLVFVLLAVVGTAGGTIALPSKTPAIWRVDTVYPHCPAQKAGLQEGDQIVAIDGRDTTDWSRVGNLLSRAPGRTVTLRVHRGVTTFSRSMKLGTRVVDGKAVGMIGVQVSGKAPPKERVDALAAVPQTFHEFATLAGKSVEGLARFFTPSHLRSYGKQVADAQKDADSSSGPSTTTTTVKPAPPAKPGVDDKACAAALAAGRGTSGSGGSDQTTLAQESRISSVLGIFNIGSQLGQRDGLPALLSVFAFMNIFIGLFNLFPMLPFDGGHVVIAVYEKLQEWRLRRRTRYFADVARLLPVVYPLILVLGLMFVSSVYLDIVNPVPVK